MPFQPIKGALRSCTQHVPPNLLAGTPPCFIDVLPSRKLVYIYIYNNISHLGKRKIIFKQTLDGVPHVSSQEGMCFRASWGALFRIQFLPGFRMAFRHLLGHFFHLRQWFGGGNHGQILDATLPETKVAPERKLVGWFISFLGFGLFSFVLSDSFREGNYDKSNWQFGCVNFVICITEIHHVLFTYVMS